MIHITPSSRQPIRHAWTMDRLIHERSILLGMAIDNTTASTYTSATNSYLAFCKLHNLPIDPTSETLSYYITFQSSHINPKSVASYLAGICNNLEPFFPDIRANRAAALVKRTLKGALRRHGQPIKRKAPLTTVILQSIATSLNESREHDDMLFLSMLNTGFPGLLRLGEMTVSDNPTLRDFRKVVLRNSLTWVGEDYEFTLPAHKADTTFEGNRVHVAQIIGAPNPQPIMKRYLSSRDILFPLHPQLWLRDSDLTDSCVVPAPSSPILPTRNSGSIHTCGWCDRARGSWRACRSYQRSWSLVIQRVRKIYTKKRYSAPCTYPRPRTPLLSKLTSLHLFFYLFCAFTWTVLVQISRFPSSFILIFFMIQI